MGKHVSNKRQRWRSLVLVALMAATMGQVGCQGSDVAGRHMVNGCKVLLVSATNKVHHVSNPNYPGFTYFRSRCWVVHVLPTLTKDHYLRLTLLDLDLHVPRDCKAAETDFIEFREGQLKTSPLIGRWCNGWIENDIITSCSNDVLVWLHVSHASATRRGFNLTYTALPKEKYDCTTRSVPMLEDGRMEDGVIAGVAIFLLLAVSVVAIIVVLRTRQRPNNPDDRLERRSSYLTQPAAFHHHRFENEAEVPDVDEEGGVLSVHQRTPSPRPSIQFSESMCESKPLPIGIPRAYRADGFPASYACNVPEINVKDVDLEFSEVKSEKGEVGAAMTAENPLYALSFPDQSGLPSVAPPSGEIATMDAQTDPLAASVPADTSGLQLGLALEDRLTGQGHMSRSAPGGAGQEVVLSLDRNNMKDESFA